MISISKWKYFRLVSHQVQSTLFNNNTIIDTLCVYIFTQYQTLEKKLIAKIMHLGYIQ